MSPKPDPVDVVRRYHAAINRLDFDAIEAFFADRAVYASNGVGSLTGRAAILSAFRAYFSEYGDQVSADENIEALSDREAVSVWRLVATSAVSGETMRRSGRETVSIDATGLIVRVEVVDD